MPVLILFRMGGGTVSTVRTAPKGFTELSLDVLQTDTQVNFDIYIWPEESPLPVLYRDRNLPFTDDQRRRLADSGRLSLFIRSDEAGELTFYVEKNLDRIIASPLVSLGDKAKLLYDTSLRLAIDILDQPETHQNLRRSEDLVRNAISYVLLGKDALHSLLVLKAYDYRTYTHSVNVCTIGLALAERVGFTNPRDLMDFGVGALFHDVGKTRIPHEVLQKTGPLNDNEWAQIRKHPLMGMELIAPHADFPEKAKSIVLQHHERLDGKGYPHGASAQDIHPFAQVAAMVDVFDAITSRRPYKEALDTYPALTVMTDEVGTHLSEEYFKEFVKLMGK